MLNHLLLAPLPRFAGSTRQTSRGTVRFLPVLLAWTLLVSCSSAAASAIRLAGYTFDPLNGVPTPAGGIAPGPSPPGALGVFIVQLHGPVTSAHHDLVETVGEILGYVPEYAYLVRTTPAQISTLATNPSVRWTGVLQPAFKLSLPLHAAVGRGSTGGPRVLRLWTVGDPTGVRQELEALGAVWIDSVAQSLGHRSIVQASDNRLADIARLPSVLWVEERPESHLHNETTAWVAQSNVPVPPPPNLPVWDQGLHGEGQIAIVMDTGVDYSADPNASCHFGPGKIVAYQWFADETYALGTDTCGIGHGTHVAGTLAGECINAVTPANNGIAYKARLVVQDIGLDGELTCTDPPAEVPGCLDRPTFCAGIQNLTQLEPLPSLKNAFEAGLALGGSVHSNSWGEGVFSDYTLMAQEVDDFMWKHPGFLVVFSAGNTSTGVGTGPIGSPGTAKNCVTVGATQQFPNQEFIASYSRRGPTSDGRLKPTVVLPGGGGGSPAINSARNQRCSGCGGNCPTNSMCGTSQATPAVSGSALLIRQYFKDKGFYPSGVPNPTLGFPVSAALLKAALINSAADIGCTPPLFASCNIPNNDEGWGRVLLDDVLYFAGDTRELRIEDESVGVGESGIATFTYQVALVPPEPLKVVLVWSDYPGMPIVHPMLVNDLDLEVEGPLGTKYFGNYFEPYGESKVVVCPPPPDPPCDFYDRKNVEEVVLIKIPVAGTYTIRVKGFNVPKGPQQPFALVTTGAFANWPP